MTAYATAADLSRLGVGAAATSDIPSGDIDAALLAASAVANSYLAVQYTLPLSSWGDDLRRAVCMIAAYDVIAGNRGFNPTAGPDVNLRLRYEDAIAWLKRVSEGTVSPADIIDATAGDPDGSAAIYTSTARGW